MLEVISQTIKGILRKNGWFFIQGQWIHGDLDDAGKFLPSVTADLRCLGEGYSLVLSSGFGKFQTLRAGDDAESGALLVPSMNYVQVEDAGSAPVRRIELRDWADKHGLVVPPAAAAGDERVTVFIPALASDCRWSVPRLFLWDTAGFLPHMRRPESQWFLENFQHLRAQVEAAFGAPTLPLRGMRAAALRRVGRGGAHPLHAQSGSQQPALPSWISARTAPAAIFGAAPLMGDAAAATAIASSSANEPSCSSTGQEILRVLSKHGVQHCTRFERKELQKLYLKMGGDPDEVRGKPQMWIAHFILKLKK